MKFEEYIPWSTPTPTHEQIPIANSGSSRAVGGTPDGGGGAGISNAMLCPLPCSDSPLPHPAPPLPQPDYTDGSVNVWIYKKFI